MARERAKGAPVLLLDTGGMFLKNPDDARREDLAGLTVDALLKAVGRIGYAAGGISPSDLSLPAELMSRLASGPVPFLSANLKEGDRAPFPPSTVREVDGRRIGIVGITGAAGLPPGGRFTVLDPTEAARRTVAPLRGSCDLVIVLSSLGIDEDARLAESVPGIDIILGGFSRIVTQHPRLVGSTLIVHAGAKGMRIGRLEVEVDRGTEGAWTERGAVRIGPGRRFIWSVIPLPAEIPDDEELARILESHREELRRRHLDDAENAPAPLPETAGAYTGASSCGLCHPDAYRQWLGSRHARALVSLENRREDANPECLPCHVTAYGEPGGYRPGGWPNLANVQCEACHGFGREHRGPGRIRGQVPERVCRRCHSGENSPEFDFVRYLGILGEHAAGALERESAGPPSPGD